MGTLLRLIIGLNFLFLLSCAEKKVAEEIQDPYLWLEEVEGKKALNWVEGENKATLAKMTGTKRYKSLEKSALNIMQAKDKIPYVSMMGKYLYNFWQDGDNVRGLWRRTTLKSYKRKKPRWETVIDFDKLAKAEKENWVYKGSNCLPPKYEKCLINLSRGGKDAAVVREFDAKKKSFVSGGFKLKEAKSWVGWHDENHLFVATDYGKGSLTESGYSKVVKLWKRGTSLDKAVTVFNGEVKDMGAYGSRMGSGNDEVSVISRLTTFFTSKSWVYEGGKLKQIPVQDSAKVLAYFKGHFVIELRKDWKVAGLSFKQGSLVSLDKKVINKSNIEKSDLQLIFEPDLKSSVLSAAILKDNIIISVLENVKGKIYSVSLKDNKFSSPQVMPLLKNGHITLAASNRYSNDFFFNYEGFLTPESLYFYNGIAKKYSLMKTLPGKFNSKNMTVAQRWATSKDGTKIPYFVVGKASQLKSGKAPTLLYGYGGFEVSRTPFYSGVTGKLWLERGGVFVLANIRGGGEFGPRWHQAALLENRQKAFDDFIAVAEDLISTKLTTTDKLAIKGGSNGGLLVGAVMTQRPDLFKGVICQVPLLDMIRYSQLLAGASWMGEYGDPRDPKMREVLLSYSPYHNVKKDKEYPELFLMTSTKDDRVHPGHARKMAAKMKNMGHKAISYYENTEGGHAASSNLKQRARMTALNYEFLFQTLK